MDMKTLTLIEEPTEEVKENKLTFVKNKANLLKFDKHLKLSQLFLFFRSWRRRKMSLKGF